jgi:hypothetical protein
MEFSSDPSFPSEKDSNGGPKYNAEEDSGETTHRFRNAEPSESFLQTTMSNWRREQLFGGWSPPESPVLLSRSRGPSFDETLVEHSFEMPGTGDNTRRVKLQRKRRSRKAKKTSLQVIFGNLPPETDVLELVEHIENTCGTVKSYDFGYLMGAVMFGFVTFHEAESVEKAAKMNKNVSLGGDSGENSCLISVTIQPSQTQKSNTSAKEVSKTLVLKNLPFTITENRLREEILVKIESIPRAVHLCKDRQDQPRGVAFVYFEDVSTAISAMRELSAENALIEGRRFFVEFYTPSRSSTGTVIESQGIMVAEKGSVASKNKHRYPPPRGKSARGAPHTSMGAVGESRFQHSSSFSSLSGNEGAQTPFASLGCSSVLLDVVGSGNVPLDSFDSSTGDDEKYSVGNASPLFFAHQGPTVPPPLTRQSPSPQENRKEGESPWSMYPSTMQPPKMTFAKSANVKIISGMSSSPTDN